MKRAILMLAALASLLGSVGQVKAAFSVAIVEGSFYTPNLKNDLVGQGVSVTEITSYTAATLASYNAVIVYGNAFTDMSALQTYVQGGGTLVETPWFWNNNSPPASLQVFSNGGGVSYSEAYPGVNVLNSGSQLLSGVSFPTGSGGFNIGRTTGNTFASGVTQVASWNDGTAFIGEKSLGAGTIVGINMHVITSDTAYQVIDQPWATQLFVNAVNAGETPTAVPEPSSLALIGMGTATFAGYFGWRRRKQFVTA